MDGVDSTMDSIPYGQILHPEDIQNLRQEGTIIASDTPGTHRVHKRRLNHSSEEEYKDLTLPSPPSTVSGSPILLPVDHFENIPDNRISRETLIFLGFNDATADIIWDRWINWGPDRGREVDGGPVTFESMFEVHIHFSGTDTCLDDDKAWHESMDSLGIGQTLQNAMMTPSCKEMRLTESCKYWLLDTISAGYASLIEIQAFSSERAKATRRAASRPDNSRTPLPPGQIPSFSGNRSISDMFQEIPDMSTATSSSPAASANATGYTVLYRGGYSTYFLKIFDEQGNVNGDTINVLQTRHGGDFNSRQNAIYMALDFEVAQKYAFWAKKRSLRLAVSILRMEIPNAAIESLDDKEMLKVYWPSEEWKQLVWKCRRESPLKTPLAKYSKSTLTIGTICGKPRVVIDNLASPDDITQSMILPKKDGGDAVQFVFLHEQGLDFLTDNGIRCHAYPMNSRSLHEVEAEIVGVSAL